MSETYQAAVIGLGFIGAGDQVSGDAIGGQQVSNLDGTHWGALSGNPRVRVVAGSTRDTGRGMEAPPTLDSLNSSCP